MVHMHARVYAVTAHVNLLDNCQPIPAITCTKSYLASPRPASHALPEELEGTTVALMLPPISPPCRVAEVRVTPLGASEDINIPGAVCGRKPMHVTLNMGAMPVWEHARAGWLGGGGGDGGNILGGVATAATPERYEGREGRSQT